MSLILLLPIIIAWIAGGAFVAKRVIAKHEALCMEKWGPGGTHLKSGQRPQYAMDGSDWTTAIIKAMGAVVFLPIVLTATLLKYPAMLAYMPIRAFFLPPVQHQHEVHVAEVKSVSKSLEVSVQTFMDMVRGEPSVPESELYHLRDVINDQYAELLRITKPDNALDMDMRELTRDRINWDGFKAITAKSEGR